MGLFKQLMIFGKTGLQGLPTRVALFLWAFSRQGAIGVPLFTTWDSVAGSGRDQYLETFREGVDLLNSVISVLLRQETATWGGCDLGSDGFWDQDYGWGVRVRRHFGARGRSSVRYGTRSRLGDLKEN